MRLAGAALLLLGAGCPVVAAAPSSSSSSSAVVLPASTLLSDGTNTADGAGVAAFQLDTLTPVLTWAPQHTGLLELDDLSYTVSLRPLVAATASDGSARDRKKATQQQQQQQQWAFDHTFASLEYPQLKLPAGVLAEGTSYEWVVDTHHVRTGTTARSPAARFHVGLLDPAAWDGIAWLGSNTTNLYRTDVAVADAADVRAADLYVCGLSYSAVHVNGAPASDAVLVTSAWSQNARRNFFSWFNVTAAVQQQQQPSAEGGGGGGGTVGVGVALGSGWRNTSSFPRHDADWTGDGVDPTERVVRAQLRLTYANGTVVTVGATLGDGSWTTAAGPVIADSVYDGETYDARMAQPGWSAANYDAAAAGFADAWGPAAAVPNGPAGAMTPWAAPPVAVSETLAPVSIKPHASPDNYTCATAGPEGTTVELSCPGAGNVITDVTFAAYGQPQGTCAVGDLAHNSACDADIAALVTTLCKGNQTCSVECDGASCAGQQLPGGDPCFGQVKTLAVAVSCTTPPPLPPPSYIVDFGRNLAGVVRLSGIQEPAGQQVVLRHAEILQHYGLPGMPSIDTTAIYQDNLRTAMATDTYISSSNASAEYTPTMTYHGFRFVEISGLSAAPAASQVELLHFHSDVAKRAQANFSSPTLNRILAMAVGSQHSNMMSVPTDCDQRDERLGWMGDADLSSDSMCLNFDCPAFFKSFLLSMADELSDTDGSLTDTVPWVRYGGRPGDVSWTAAFPQYVYTLFKSAGDLDTARAYLPRVLQHLSNIEAQANVTGGVCAMHTPYGDWCPPPSVVGGGQGPKPSSPYTTVFAYATMVAQAAELAAALNDTGNATRLHAQAAALVSQFNDCFLQPGGGGGNYDNGVMTTDVLALEVGAAAAANATAATRANLTAKVSELGNHFTTGIIGFKFLFKQLAAAGQQDVALAVLEQTTYPAIGYEATNALEPATYNLWELTDAPFEGTGMNSRNHHMFSSFSSHLQQSLAGLHHTHDASTADDHATAQTAGVASRVTFAPATALGLRAASSSLQLRHGRAAHQWQRHGGVQCAQAAGADEAVLDCGALGGTIARVEFGALGPVPAGTCGALVTSPLSPCAGVDLRARAAAACEGRQRCSFSAAAELERQGLSATDAALCVRTELGEVPAVALQATCSVPSVVDTVVHAPVATHTRVLELPATALLASDGRGASLVVRRVAADGSETDVLQVSHDAAGDVAVVATAGNVPGVVVTEGGSVRLELAGGHHHFRAAVVSAAK